MNTYIATQVIDINATYHDENGNLIDPTTVRFKYDASNTTPVTYTFAGSTTPGTGHIWKNGTGAYEVYLDTTPLLGYVIWSWPSSGTGQTDGASSAIVYPTP